MHFVHIVHLLLFTGTLTCVGSSCEHFYGHILPITSLTFGLFTLRIGNVSAVQVLVNVFQSVLLTAEHDHLKNFYMIGKINVSMLLAVAIRLSLRRTFAVLLLMVLDHPENRIIVAPFFIRIIDAFSHPFCS